MVREIVFHPSAKHELSEIISYYENQKRGLGFMFLDVFELLIKRIQQYPLQFPLQHKKIRRVTLQDFPYNIFFRIHKNQLVILAILHQKRNQKIWREGK